MGKPEEKIILWSQTRVWGNNVKIYLEESGCEEDEQWIYLAQGTSWVAERLLASQERLRCKVLLMY
jgi:hypothetical protein